MIRLQISAIEDDTKMSDCDGNTLALFTYDSSDDDELHMNVDVNTTFAELEGSAQAMVLAVNALSVCSRNYLKLLHQEGAFSSGPDDRLIDYCGGADDE